MNAILPLSESFCLNDWNTGCEMTLAFVLQPQPQTSQKIYTKSREILSIWDSGHRFQEPELVFEG